MTLKLIPDELEYELKEPWRAALEQDYREWSHKDVLEWLEDLNDMFWDEFGERFEKSTIDGRSFHQLMKVSFLEHSFAIRHIIAVKLSDVVSMRVQHYHANQLQVALINNICNMCKIECDLCGSEIDEKVQLFQCDEQECKNTKTGRIFCADEDCTNTIRKLHKKLNRYHEFDISHVICINEMVNSFHNAKYEKGEKSRLQIKRFNRFGMMQHFFGAMTEVLSIGTGEVVSVMQYNTEMITSITGDIIGLSACALHLIGSGIGAAVACGLELGILFYRKCSGKIETWHEFFRLVGKSVTGHTVSFAGFAGCVAVGTLGGPGGVVCGIVGGIIVGCLLRWQTNKIYDEVFKSKENKERHALATEALKYFHFEQDDIEKEAIFNKKEIQRRYRLYAMVHHPDKNRHKSDVDNVNESWLKLCSYYGTLIAICDELENNNINVNVENNNVVGERRRLLTE